MKTGKIASRVVRLVLVVKLSVRVKNRSSKVTVSSKVTCKGKELK